MTNETGEPMYSYVKIYRSANSLRITIPKKLANRLRLEAGQILRIEATSKTTIEMQTEIPQRVHCGVKETEYVHKSVDK